MLQQLTVSVRRHAAALFDRRLNRAADAGAQPDHPVIAAQAEIGMLRGVTAAAADVAECTCPQACERDHANE